MLGVAAMAKLVSKSIVKDFARNMDAEMISKACKSARARFMKVCKMKGDNFEHLL